MNYPDLPREPANPAKVHTQTPWPAGKQSCLFLSFDFDGEAAWIDEDPDNWRQKVTMSHGGFGARVGMRKILELLKEKGLNATFFVPGWTVEAHTEICEEILKQGHEIGHHGTYHLKPDPSLLDQGLKEIDEGFDILKSRLGVDPVGYRAPLGENSPVFLKHLQDRGVRYSSSWRDDVHPYRHVLSAGMSGPLELPANYFFDDWMHGLIKGSGRNLVAREQVLSMWMDELEVTHDWGALLTTIFHPQVSGRPSRFKILEEFLDKAMGISGLWIATGAEIEAHLSVQDQFAK